MKPEYKAKWVAALRSGKYKQGRSALQSRSGSMCCLGVLCDIVKDEVGGVWQTEYVDHDEADNRPKAFCIEGSSADLNYPPDAVINLVSLDNSRIGRDVFVIHKSTVNEHGCVDHGLAALNDSGKYTFAQIADIIEEQL